MDSKKFSLALISVAGMFAVTTIFFWHFVTKPIFYGYDSHGDLARIGLIEIAPPLTMNVKYKKHHKELRDYLAEKSSDKFSVLTIGDSHSDGVGGAYYQDYLTDKYGMSIINSAGTKKYNSWQQLMFLMNFGYLEKFGVNTVIYEIGERGVAWLAAAPLNAPKISKEKYEKDRISYIEPTGRDMVSPYAFITTIMGSANVKFIKNRLYAQKHENAVAKEVYREKLTIPAFTNPGQENVLYYYVDDMLYLQNKPNAAAINDKINEVADKLMAKGIRLVFLVVPDKSDIYYPYVIRENKIPENVFFDELRPLPKRYIFVDSKVVLREAVAHGEKDVYWADDTHWTWKAQQIVGNEIYAAMKD